MEPSTIIQLRAQLEALKKFEQLNAPNRFSYFGYLGELFLGAIILGQLLIVKGLENITIAGIPHFVEWVSFIISLVLISHSLYLIFRYHSDKRRCVGCNNCAWANQWLPHSQFICRKEPSHEPTKNLGMLLLSVWLILLSGLIPLISLSFAGLGTIMAVLAIAAGTLILLGK